jgi:hypothetical protein
MVTHYPNKTNNSNTGRKYSVAEAHMKVEGEKTEADMCELHP